MKSKNFIKVSLWVLATMLIVSVGFNCLNAPSTSQAIFGAIIIIAWAAISYETNLFKNIKFKFFKNIKNHEKVYCLPNGCLWSHDDLVYNKS